MPLETLVDIHEIKRLLPHRYPFLLVDRVIGFEAGKSLTALKNVTVNEPFFQGHFPSRPVMPGVLVIEAMAQASGLLAFKTHSRPAGDNVIFYLVGVDNARFKKPIGPGDQVILDVEALKVSRGVWKFAATAKVDGQVVASAELMCAEREVE